VFKNLRQVPVGEIIQAHEASQGLHPMHERHQADLIRQKVLLIRKIMVADSLNPQSDGLREFFSISNSLKAKVCV